MSSQELDIDQKINLLKFIPASERKKVGISLDQITSYNAEEVDLEEDRRKGEDAQKNFFSRKSTKNETTDEDVPLQFLQKSEAIKQFPKHKQVAIPQKYHMVCKPLNQGPIEHTTQQMRDTDSFILAKQKLAKPIQYEPQEQFRKIPLSEPEQRRLEKQHEKQFLATQVPEVPFSAALDSRIVLPNPHGLILPAQQLKSLQQKESALPFSHNMKSKSKSSGNGINELVGYTWDHDYRENKQRMHLDKPGLVNEKWFTSDTLLKGNETQTDKPHIPQHPKATAEIPMIPQIPFANAAIDQNKPLVVSKFIDQLGDSLEKINIAPKTGSLKSKVQKHGTVEPIQQRMDIVPQHYSTKLIPLKSDHHHPQQHFVQPNTMTKESQPNSHRHQPSQKFGISSPPSYMETEKNNSKLQDSIMIMTDQRPKKGISLQPIIPQTQRHEIPHQTSSEQLRSNASGKISSRPNFIANYASFEAPSEQIVFTRKTNVQGSLSDKPSVSVQPVTESHQDNNIVQIQDSTQQQIRETPSIPQIVKLQDVDERSKTYSHDIDPRHIQERPVFGTKSQGEEGEAANHFHKNAIHFASQPIDKPFATMRIGKEGHSNMIQLPSFHKHELMEEKIAAGKRSHDSLRKQQFEIPDIVNEHKELSRDLELERIKQTRKDLPTNNNPTSMTLRPLM